jgi:cytochrome c-type protein NapC
VSPVGLGVALAALVAGALAATLALRPQWTSGQRGWLLSFFGLFLLPVAVTWAGVSVHLEEAKSTEFCLSCHEMEPYGASLQADQLDWLPASHYQNRRVPREAACYACHTDYTMFGDVSAKLRGARHVWVHYFGDVPPPGEIELYVPYQNRECLHCHGGARAFEESILHADMLAELEGGEVSCLDCHGEVHHVGDDR